MTSVIMLFIELLLDIVLLQEGLSGHILLKAKFVRLGECWLPLCRYFCCAII
jgi:hypothetical protein